MPTLHPALLIGLALCLAAPAPGLADGAHGHSPAAAHADHDDEDDDHVAASDFGLLAVHPWTRATTGSEALVFVELENGAGALVTLIGAESPAARAATLVGFRLVDGAPTHEPIPALPIEPDGEIALVPFGLAIRLEGLSAPLVEGGQIPVTLLTDRGALSMVAAVEVAGATAHSHAGHAHD